VAKKIRQYCKEIEWATINWSYRTKGPDWYQTRSKNTLIHRPHLYVTATILQLSDRSTRLMLIPWLRDWAIITLFTNPFGILKSGPVQWTKLLYMAPRCTTLKWSTKVFICHPLQNLETLNSNLNSKTQKLARRSKEHNRKGEEHVTLNNQKIKVIFYIYLCLEGR